MEKGIVGQNTQKKKKKRGCKDTLTLVLSSAGQLSSRTSMESGPQNQCSLSPKTCKHLKTTMEDTILYPDYVVMGCRAWWALDFGRMGSYAVSAITQQGKLH